MQQSPGWSGLCCYYYLVIPEFQIQITGIRSDHTGIFYVQFFHILSDFLIKQPGIGLCHFN